MVCTDSKPFALNAGTVQKASRLGMEPVHPQSRRWLPVRTCGRTGSGSFCQREATSPRGCRGEGRGRSGHDTFVPGLSAHSVGVYAEVSLLAGALLGMLWPFLSFGRWAHV